MAHTGGYRCYSGGAGNQLANPARDKNRAGQAW